VLRLNADRLRARVDDRALIAISLGLAAAGLVVVALPFGFTVSALGFAIVGIGTGAIVPCGFALVGTRPGVSATASISAVAFFGLFPRAPAPLAIGLIAGAFSLPTAFVSLAALLIVALVAVLVFVPAPNIVLRRASP
jgi:MFS family permease